MVCSTSMVSKKLQYTCINIYDIKKLATANSSLAIRLRRITTWFSDACGGAFASSSSPRSSRCQVVGFAKVV